MKNQFSLILVVFTALICNCGDSAYENFKKRQAKERLDFETNISEKQKLLIHDFFTGMIERADSFKGINGGFYCLWKQRDIDIYPHLALIDKFKSNGYKVTKNRDSLEYIVVSESISHKVGTYSNGGDATKMEVVISVIDINEGKAYTINSVIGSSPPSSIRRRAGSDSGAIGSFFGDEDIYDYLIQKVILE